MNTKTENAFYKENTKYKAHIAHKSLNIVGKKRSHPYSVNFLLGSKNKHVIINPYQTFEKLLKSLYVIGFFSSKRKSLLIVNTNTEYANLIENFYRSTVLKNQNHSVCYCNEKWVGGFLTNWKIVKESIQTFMEFSERFESFILQNNINFPRYKKMAQSFQGLNKNSLQKRPDLIFLINPNVNRHVVEEAVSLNIPVVAITDSNTNLVGISYPIPGNSNSIEFVNQCLQWIVRVISKCTLDKKKQIYKSRFFKGNKREDSFKR